MARQIRREPEPENVMPDYLVTFVPEQWADDEADDADELAEHYGKLRARQIMRHQRYSSALTLWKIKHRVGRYNPEQHTRPPWVTDRDMEWARRFPLLRVQAAEAPR
jgi:hypothetical protein